MKRMIVKEISTSKLLINFDNSLFTSDGMPFMAYIVSGIVNILVAMADAGFGNILV